MPTRRVHCVHFRKIRGSPSIRGGIAHVHFPKFLFLHQLTIRRCPGATRSLDLKSWNDRSKQTHEHVSVHASVMVGWGWGVGSYLRAVNLGAVGSNRKVGHRLSIVRDFMNDKFDQEKDLQSRTKVSTLFLSSFSLFIHSRTALVGWPDCSSAAFCERHGCSCVAECSKKCWHTLRCSGTEYKALYCLAALVAKCAAETAWNANYVLSPPMDIRHTNPVN